MTDDESDLRRWRLPRGRHGLPRELVTRSQRERLMAAVVRVTAANGYDSTSVADILEEAGVGRESFYELFEDKKDCLLAARRILVDDLNATVADAYGQPEPWADRVRRALAAMLDWFAAEPAAAKVVFVELAAVGAPSRELFRADFARFTKLMDDGLEQAEPIPGLPRATALARTLADGGGFCDCEVLMNVFSPAVRLWTPGRWVENGDGDAGGNRPAALLAP